jgi:predicted ATPase/class 3 adenylate cyclase
MPNTIFLFTDIEGSTKLWEQHPEQMSVAVAKHDVLLRESVTGHGGSVVKMSGDGVHAVFTDARQALLAAIAIQKELLNHEGIEIALRVRCGLHAGEAEQRDGDYYGTTVNRCARLCNAANGGQIIFSQAVHEQLEDALPAPMDARNLGSLRLRDLNGVETVYQLLHPNLPDQFPPLRALSTNANNLPFLINSFVGRQAEIKEITRLFTLSRLVCLIGVGGIGKTRLSLQAAANLLDRYPDGVWVVSLAAIDDPARIADMVMQALGLRAQGSATVEAQVIEHCRDKKLLLLIDNCEHLIDAVARFCANLLQHAAHVHILATSREGLEIDGEAAYAIPVLQLPDPDFSAGAKLRSASAIAEVASVRLFLDRAVLNRHDFQLTDAEAITLARICYRLDGIPLAIELAAARVRTMTLAEIDRGMDDRFGLLVVGSRVAAPRQKTLQATLEWSYALLTEDERALFAQLGIFSGGGSLAAVAKSCDLCDDDMRSLMQALADKSLIQLAEVAGENRFSMLETLRQFAKQKLDASQQSASLMTRYAAWYRDYMVAVAPQLFGSDRVSHLARLDADLANLRATIQYFINTNPLSAIECAIAMGRYWLWRGLYAEARDFLEASLAAAAHIDEIPPALEAKARYFAGGHCYTMSALVAAEQHYQLALKASENSNDNASAGAAMSGLAMVAYVQHGYAASKKLFEDSIVLSLGSGDNRMAANNLSNHANNAAYANDIDTAQRSLAQLETLSAQLAEPMTEARLASSHGQSLLHRGQFAEAACWFRRNLETARQMSDKSHIGIGHFLLATALTGMGDLRNAASEFMEAINMLSQNNSRLELCNALEAFAFWCSKNGDDYSAVMLCAATLSAREKIGFPVGAQAKEARRRALDVSDKSLDRSLREQATALGKRMSLSEVVVAALQLAIRSAQ